MKEKVEKGLMLRLVKMIRKRNPKNIQQKKSERVYTTLYDAYKDIV